MTAPGEAVQEKHRLITEEQKPRTSASRKTLQASRETWPYIKNEYAMGHQWKKEGKPVAWSCALVEKDLYYAMGVHPFFPEQFAALAAVRRKTPDSDKEAVRLCRIAEADGFRDYLCGYARVCLGYVLSGDLTDAPLGGMPAPDFLVTTSSTCDVRLKWFEYMSQKLNVPLFTLDRPERQQDMIACYPGMRGLVYPYKHNLERGRVDFVQSHAADYEVDYYVSQLEDFIAFMERVTGNKFSKDKLNECMDWAYKTNQVRQQILQLRKAVPAPMPCTDGFATMFPGFYTSGTERCYNFYVKVRDELKYNVEHGIGAIPNEKFRLLWYGIPSWYNMGIFNYFEKYGGVFAYEPNYNPVPWPPRRPEDPLREMAMRTLMEGTGVGAKLSSLIHDCREYKISGVVLSYLITCRPYAFPSNLMRKALEEELGIPMVALEGDLVDERLFSEAQVNTRLDAFAEQLLKRGPRA